MTKFFRHAAIALAILCAGGMATSCDSDTIQQILALLFNTGETYTYQGTATSQALTGTYSTGEWYYVNDYKDAQLSAMQVSLQSSTTATLTLPPYSDGKVTVNQITIYNLDMTAAQDNSYTVLSVGDNSSIDGSIVVDGVTYTTMNLYIEQARATSGALSFQVTIYFQADNETDYTKAINLTYTGSAIETAQ